MNARNPFLLTLTEQERVVVRLEFSLRRRGKTCTPGKPFSYSVPIREKGSPPVEELESTLGGPDFWT